MPDDTSAVQFVGGSRERGSRTALTDNARMGGNVEARLNASTDGGGDEAGYWDGDSYTPFFQLGVSEFGDGSVLKG